MVFIILWAIKTSWNIFYLNIAFLVWLDQINFHAIQKYLSNIKPHKWSNIVKHIHDWQPTYGVLCHQGRERSSLCPRCQATVETADHINTCPEKNTEKCWISNLQTFLADLECLDTAPCILTTLEFKLLNALNIPFSQWYACLILFPGRQNFSFWRQYVTKTSLVGIISLRVLHLLCGRTFKITIRWGGAVENLGIQHLWKRYYIYKRIFGMIKICFCMGTDGKMLSECAGSACWTLFGMYINILLNLTRVIPKLHKCP